MYEYNNILYACELHGASVRGYEKGLFSENITKMISYSSVFLFSMYLQWENNYKR